MQKLEKIIDGLGAYICDDLCYYRETSMDKNDEGMEAICSECKVGEYLEAIRKHMNDGWIPVEKRLPEKFSIGVEVTTKDLERNIARYAKPPMDMWISVYTGRTLDVIAWKEPSESYHPEGLETRKELEEDSKGEMKE